MPRVTVAICTYNRAHYLAESLQSVTEQTYKDIDIVVFDNASTDNTESVVRSFSDPRIKYIKNEKNIGGIRNMNKALEYCKTEFLVIFHDDDIMLLHMIETEVEAMDEQPDAAIVAQVYSSIIIDSNGRISSSNKHQQSGIITYNKNDYINESITQNKGCILTCPSVMFRNSYVQKFNLKFDENCGPAADWLMWLRINTLDCKIVGIFKPIMKYRIHGYNDSVGACQDYRFRDSYLYIYNFLKTTAFADKLNGFKESVISTSAMKLGYGFLTDPPKFTQDPNQIFLTINGLESMFETKLSSYRRVVTGILSPVVVAIGQKKAPISYYFILRRVLQQTLNATPSFIRELEWALKYFVYFKYLR